MRWNVNHELIFKRMNAILAATYKNPMTRHEIAEKVVIDKHKMTYQNVYTYTDKMKKDFIVHVNHKGSQCIEARVEAIDWDDFRTMYPGKKPKPVAEKPAKKPDDRTHGYQFIPINLPSAVSAM